MQLSISGNVYLVAMVLNSHVSTISKPKRTCLPTWSVYHSKQPNGMGQVPLIGSRSNIPFATGVVGDEISVLVCGLSCTTAIVDYI